MVAEFRALVLMTSITLTGVGIIGHAPSSLAAALTLYDKFDSEYLDTTKWRPGSFSDNIESGYFEVARGTLNMGMRTFADFNGTIGGSDQSWSNVWISKDRSDTAREIQVKVRIRSLSADRCERGRAPQSYAEFQQRAFWFNDGTTRPGSQFNVGLGDVYTNLSLSQSSLPNDPINIFANVFHVTENGTERIFSQWLGSLRNRNRLVILRTTWDRANTRFRFVRKIVGEGVRSTVFNYRNIVQAKSRPAWQFNGKGLTLRTFPAYCGKRQTYTEAEAVVEQVWVR